MSKKIRPVNGVFVGHYLLKQEPRVVSELRIIHIHEVPEEEQSVVLEYITPSGKLRKDTLGYGINSESIRMVINVVGSYCRVRMGSSMSSVLHEYYFLIGKEFLVIVYENGRARHCWYDLAIDDDRERLKQDALNGFGVGSPVRKQLVMEEKELTGVDNNTNTDDNET